MKNVFATTNNVRRFMAGMEVLKRPVGRRIGLMLVTGPYGCGKSEIGEWYNNNQGMPYARMTKGCTRRKMLSDIVHALQVAPKYRADDMFDQILNILDDESQPLIIDEADYLIKDGHIETIRDINDLTNAPIVLVGMEELPGSLNHYPHLVDRITVRVELDVFDEAEIAACAEQICEVKLSDDSIRFIRLHGAGRLRMTTTWFERAERIARFQKLDEVTAEYLEAYRLKEEKSRRTT